MKDYINKNIKKVSKEHLKKVLHELNEKNKEQMREDAQSLSKALSDGFRCTNF